MKAKGAYLLQWRMIEWAKGRDATRYDLGGINPESNPGVHHFKAGMGGKDLLYLQPFASCRNPASRAFVRTAEAVRPRLRELLARFRGGESHAGPRAQTSA
jgi:lipid II:glycine glycyltransferase (peptidoglycan interpeptide bridge formation enzyme)